VLQTPFCGELRSKKYYLRNEILTTAEEYLDSFGHTWCYHTQMPVGPDGYRVSPDECGPGRPCYRSALSQPASPLLARHQTAAGSSNPEV
jgi:hypothetical protein